MPRRDNRRHFSKSQQKEILYQQNSCCAECGNTLDLRATHFDHIVPWARGGETIVSNGQALCSNCHSIKDHKESLELVEPEKDEYPRDNELFNPFGPSPFDPEPERRPKRKGSHPSSAFEPPSFPDVFGSSSFARNPFEPEQKKKGKGRDKRPPWGFSF